MKPLLPAPSLRPFSIFVLACTAMSANDAYAGPISEAEALARAAALPEITALNTAAIDAARADAQAVLPFENPELHVGRERVSGGLGTETEWAAELTQPLGISGVNSRLRAAAQAQAQAVDADIVRRNSVRSADVRKAYAECGAATERVSVLNEQDGRLRKIERIVSLRARAGDAAGYDLRRVRIEARNITAKKAMAEGEIRASCATLSRLTGEQYARTIGPLFALLTPPRAVLETANGRSDLEALRFRASAAKAQADAARRQRIPDIAVGAGYKRISDGNLSASGPTVALAIRLPIFSGSAATRAAEARKRAAEAEVALASGAIVAEREAAFARAEAGYEAAQLAQSTAEDARRIADIADAAYQGGETGITELIDGYRAGSEAQIATIDLTERALKARADYILAHEGDEQ